MKQWMLLTIPLLILSACGGAAAPEPNTLEIVSQPPSLAVATNTPLPEPSPTDRPTPLPPPPTATQVVVVAPTDPPAEVIVVAPTEEIAVPEPPPPPTKTPLPEPTATPEVVDWLNSVGRTADNLMYVGNPDAPVSVIDFSDFM